MSTPRRVYIYLVSGVSLQAVTWAVISLLRNLLLSRMQPDRVAIAFQIAVIIIGVPIFLGHWLWGQRLARKEVQERSAGFRKFYLYGMQALLLVPIIDSSLAAVSNLFRLATGVSTRLAQQALRGGETVLYYVLALIVLAPLWYYLRTIIDGDAQFVPEAGSSATVRRAYVYLFSAIGLTMSAAATVSLLQWVMLQVDRSSALTMASNARLFYELSRLAIGFPVWLIFWRWAERLFAGSSAQERASSLRKVYLYLTVLAATLILVTSAALIMDGWFRRLLSGTSGGAGGDVNLPLSLMIGMAAVWGYHAQTLRQDADAAEEAPRQARIRRIYSYLIGAIGFSAFIAGVAGVASALIQSLDATAIGTPTKSLLAGSAAAVLAGLPVWVLPWRGSQITATEPGEEGAAERRSVARRIFLYFFMLVATLTVLSNVVFIVFRILSAALGEDAPALVELGQAIAFTGIGAGVWLYHGNVLREDGRRVQQDQVERMEGMRVVFVDPENGGSGQRLVEAIGDKIPGLTVERLGANKAETSLQQQSRLATDLASADVIIGAWSMMGLEIASAIRASPARKLVYPTPIQAWDWIGVDPPSESELLQQSTAAIEQILKGEKVKALRPLSVGAVLGILLAVIVLLMLISVPILSYLLLSVF